MRTSIEETTLDFLGKKIYRMNGVNQKALAALNLETELIGDLGLNDFQLDLILQSFKDQFHIDCCEEQFAQSKTKIHFLSNTLIKYKLRA